MLRYHGDPVAQDGMGIDIPRVEIVLFPHVHSHLVQGFPLRNE
jgi:hypothetical protein